MGSINAVANVAPRPQRQLYEKWQSPDAPTMQEDVNQLRQAVEGFAAIPTLKQIMALLHSDPSWLNVHPPFMNLTVAEADELLGRGSKLSNVRVPEMA